MASPNVAIQFRNDKNMFNTNLNISKVQLYIRKKKKLGHFTVNL